MAISYLIRSIRGHLKAQLHVSKGGLLVALATMAASGPIAPGQQPPPASRSEMLIHGVVLSAEGKPVAGARVKLQRNNQSLAQKETNAAGTFEFLIHDGKYSLSAEKLGRRSPIVDLSQTSSENALTIKLVLGQDALDAGKSDAGQAMQFSDQPNFTVAGITDFTAAGGHGSDSSLRTSEALARETSNLKSAEGKNNPVTSGISNESEDRLRAALARAPDSFDANHRLGEFYLQSARYTDAIPLLQNAYSLDKNNRENEYDLALARKAIGDSAHSKQYVQELLTREESADLYRLAGELDESLGDSLAAVREFQKAVSFDPSEQNLFEWGSELLVHRAIWQAQQVFAQGAARYPSSSRMLTGLGTALFSGAAYEQAATQLCHASDLKPSDPEPYIFLGKVQMAAPNRLDCIEQRLERFVQQQPGSADANYLYAMAILKREDHSSNAEARKQSEALLRSAIAIDPKYSEAYLQLGNLYSTQKDFTQAIGFYAKAIETDPRSSDAYYHLAVAYDRSGQPAKAKDEFALHDQIAKQQAAEVERQRQEVKQFLITLPGQSPHSPTQ